MPTTRFSNEPHYVESVRALLRLHEFEVAGASESSEADAVRDSLERPWLLLSEPERKRITGLSEDLYSITIPTATAEMTPQAQCGLIEAFEARKAGRWDQALELMRQWGTHIEPALCSYLRGSIWMEAGDSATASVFFRHAADLDEHNVNYECLYLQTLHNAYPARADDLAQKILSEHASHRPGLVIKAAEIRFVATKTMSEVDSRPVVSEILNVLESIVTGSDPNEPLMDSVYAMAVALVAFCYDHLGNASAALEYYNKGIAGNPENEALLVARGILRYGADADAVHDFQAAIRAGTRMVWPFFFLAHQYLVNDRFAECLRVCEGAVELAASDSARANLFEWIGISRSELGMPAQTVREAFEEALRLAPDNDRIRSNLRAFEAAIASQNLPVAWHKASEATVQALGRIQYDPALAA